MKSEYLDEEKRDINIGIKVNKRGKLLVILIIAVLIICALLFFIFGARNNKTKIITKATLKKFIKINELSSYQFLYNGIVPKYSDKDNKDVKYYLYYEGKIKAGINPNKIDYKIKRIEKTVIVTLPEVKITERYVDIKSLDFMFQKNFVDKSRITSEGYFLAKEDLKRQTSKKKEPTIYTIARKNARKIVKGLIKPFVKDYGYDVVVK